MGLTSFLDDECLAPRQRLRGALALHQFAGLPPDRAAAAERSIASAAAGCTRTYLAHLRRVAYNLACNPAMGSAADETLVSLSDEQWAVGTIIERVQKEEAARLRTCTEILREKYENVVRAHKTDSILKCKGCGSSDIALSQKQTRGADESSTIFCQCHKCSKRWRLS